MVPRHSHHRHGHQRRGRDPLAVAAQELRRPAPQGVGASLQWFTPPEVLQIPQKRLHGAVAPVGILMHRGEAEDIQIRPRIPADPVRVQVPARHRRRSRGLVEAFQSGRDPEIQELPPAFIRDEHIRGLEIAVDHRLLVCVLHRLSYGTRAASSPARLARGHPPGSRAPVGGPGSGMDRATRWTVGGASVVGSSSTRVRTSASPYGMWVTDCLDIDTSCPGLEVSCVMGGMPLLLLLGPSERTEEAVGHGPLSLICPPRRTEQAVASPGGLVKDRTSSRGERD